MARRTWHDTPATDSPLAAALLNDLEARKPEMELMVEVNANEAPFNATGLGLASDKAAIAAACDSLPQTGDTRGGRVVLGPGVYLIDSQLNLDRFNSLVIEGAGGNSNKQATILRWTGAAGSGSMISLKSTQGVTFRGVRIDYSNAAYNGNLIDCGELDVGVPTTNLRFENCWMGGIVGNVAARCVVRLNQVANVVFDGCSLFGAQRGVIGIDTGFSNAVCFVGCVFNFLELSAIHNPGQGWSIQTTSFEPLTNGKAGAITHDTDVLARGLAIGQGCWFGDCTVDGGIWIDTYCFGLFVGGCFMDLSVSGGASTTGTHFRLDKCEGVSIMGGEFQEGQHWVNVISFCLGLSLVGNRPQGVDNYVTGESLVTGMCSLGNQGAPNHIRGIVSASEFVYAYTGDFTQVRLGSFGGVAGVMLGTDGDAAVERVSAGTVGVRDKLNFPAAVAAAGVPNNTIFRDSADNVIKVKNNAGVVTAI